MLEVMVNDVIADMVTAMMMVTRALVEDKE